MKSFNELIIGDTLSIFNKECKTETLTIKTIVTTEVGALQLSYGDYPWQCIVIPNPNGFFAGDGNMTVFPSANTELISLFQNSFKFGRESIQNELKNIIGIDNGRE